MNLKSASVPFVVTLCFALGLICASEKLTAYAEEKKIEFQKSLTVIPHETAKPIIFDFKKMFPSIKAEILPNEQFVYFSTKLYPTYSADKDYIKKMGILSIGFSDCIFSISSNFKKCTSHDDCPSYIVTEDSNMLHYESKLLAPLVVTEFYIDSTKINKFIGKIYNAYFADYGQQLNPELWSYDKHNFFMDENDTTKKQRSRVTVKPPVKNDMAFMTFKENIPHDFYANFILEAKYKKAKKLRPIIVVENMMLTIGEKKESEIRVYNGKKLVEKKQMSNFSNEEHTMIELLKEGDEISIWVNAKQEISKKIFTNNQWSNISIGIRRGSEVYEIQSITLRQALKR